MPLDESTLRTAGKCSSKSQYIRCTSCPKLGSDGRSMSFDRVFDERAAQPEIWDELQPLVHSCCQGYNVSFMSYGQTGSGKTYTMMGTNEVPGLTLLASRCLFNELNKVQFAVFIECCTGSRTFTLTASFPAIFGIRRYNSPSSNRGNLQRRDSRPAREKLWYDAPSVSSMDSFGVEVFLRDFTTFEDSHSHFA